MTPELETCFHCDEPTGRCGDDSLYDEEGVGPFCQECFENECFEHGEGMATIIRTKFTKKED